MASIDEKKKWLAGLGAKATEQEDFQKKHRIKEAVAAKMSQEIRKRGQELFDGMNLVVAVDGKKKMNVIEYGLLDQTRVFDLDEMQDGYELYGDADPKDPEAMRLAQEKEMSKHLQAQRIVMELSAELEGEIELLDDNGQPTGEKVKLSDDKDALKELLRDELYEPLVRQGLLSETFVPDEFSTTREMLDESFKAYGERLERDYVKSPTKRFFKENLGLMKAVGGSMVGLASAGVQFAQVEHLDQLSQHLNSDGKPLGEDGQPLPDSENPFTSRWDQFTDGDSAQRFTEAFTKKLTEGDEVNVARAEIASMGYELLMKVDDAREDSEVAKEDLKALKEMAMGEKATGRGAAAARVAQAAIGAIGSAFSEVLRPAGLGGVASTTFQGVAKVAPLAKALAAKPADPALFTTAIDELDGTFATVLTKIDPQVGNSTTALKGAADAMAKAFRGGVDAGKLAGLIGVEDEKKLDFGPVLDHLSAAAELAAEAGTNAPGLMAALQDDQVKKAIKSKAAKDALDDHDRRMKALDEEKAELEKLNDEPDLKVRAGLLEKKIRRLKDDRTRLKWAAGLAGMGFDLASKALAPLALAGSLVKIAQNIMEAVKRTRDFIVFCNSQGDMMRAVSAYQHAVDNFISNATQQALHYEMVAAIEMVRFVGLILDSTGFPYAVVAGKAVQATAAVASAVEAVVYELARRYDLEMAWVTYKKALIRKGSRKLGLIAIKKNPTLAKYAVAWGAVIRKDPLVGDFISKCGLDEHTLGDPNANVDKVVEYFEARFPDDNVVVGRQVVVTEWAPKPLELTVMCWSASRKRGEDKADLQPMPTRALDASLLRWEQVFGETDTLRKVQPHTPTDAQKFGDLIVQCQGLLNTIDGELAGCDPQRIAGGKTLEHRDMLDLIGAFRDEVQKHQKLLAGWKG